MYNWVMEKFLFTADQHGNMDQYRRVFEHALEEEVDIVVIGGDITPKDSKFRTPKIQREFIEKELFPIIKSFKEKSDADVLIIMGNDDFKYNHQFMLEKQNAVGFQMIDDKPYVSKNGYHYVGYSYVPYTPFIYKDWERRDTNKEKDISEREKLGIKIEGVVSMNNDLVSYNILNTMMDYSIEDDINKITKDIPRDKLVLVTHSPPYGTACDYTCMGKKDVFDYVGSKAIRQFIEDEQPLLTLHGHIHDTVELSKKFPEELGNTLCASVGNDNIPKTPYVVIGELSWNVSLERLLLE